MAAVRLAARRLTGQQSQAILRSAVAKEHGLLNRGGSPAHALRRFTSSEASVANGPKISTEHPYVSEAARYDRLRTLQRKTGEIYNLLAEIQMDKGVPYTTRMKDRRLLQHLSSRVDPSNAGWRKYSLERAIDICLGGASTFMATLYMYEKWRSFHQNRQVQGAGSNSKASVSGAEE